MVQLDIPMPKTCYECPCHDGENNSCQVTGKYYYDEILRSCPLVELPFPRPNVPDTNVGDTISRQAAIDALWKALYEYEDKTEKQFQESEDLDVGDWIEHRIFVQNMNDIDRQTILKLPSAQPETEWNNHTVACLLAELFGDTCACNFNGIDGWLPEKCEVIDSCPNPVGVACWEQFLTHRAERRTG